MYIPSKWQPRITDKLPRAIFIVRVSSYCQNFKVYGFDPHMKMCSVNSINLQQENKFFFVLYCIKTSQTVDEPYGDTFPFSECSLPSWFCLCYWSIVCISIKLFGYKESLACQITFPFNNKLGYFIKLKRSLKKTAYFSCRYK